MLLKQKNNLHMNHIIINQTKIIYIQTEIIMIQL